MICKNCLPRVGQCTKSGNKLLRENTGSAQVYRRGITVKCCHIIKGDTLQQIKHLHWSVSSPCHNGSFLFSAVEEEENIFPPAKEDAVIMLAWMISAEISHGVFVCYRSFHKLCFLKSLHSVPVTPQDNRWVR